MVETFLQDFEVLQKLIIVFSLPVDFAHGHMSRIYWV